MASGTEAVTVEQVARALGVPAPAPPLPSETVATSHVDGAEVAAVTLKQFKVWAAKNGHR